jgi:unsaturated rhamnogalacturonyl hydrolase
MELAPTDPLRSYLEDTLDAQCEALQRLQEPSGYWRTLLDQKDEGSYIEASATAGFAFGILKGIRKRYISEGYRSVAENAIGAVLKSIDENGEHQNTSFGTGMGDDLDHYRKIAVTAMPYGQAMAMMALGEYLRTYI